jgi:signal recognition particle subunit SRP54
VLDETLKEVCKALLESDINVKLVQSLRNKVKAKVKASLEASEKDKAKSEAQRKSIVQKVYYLTQGRG